MTTTTAARQPYGTTYGGTATENYERFFVPVIARPLAEDLVKDATLRPGERVLDVACGTGIVARLAAEGVGAHGSVAAVDVNAGMLAVARAIASGAAAPIQWYETPAEHMPLSDDSFDVAFCQLGLQFVEDKAAALREIRRVLVSGGRLHLSVPMPTPFWSVMEEAFEKHVPAGAPFVRLVFSLHDPAVVERLLRDAGFADVSVRRDTRKMRLPAPCDFLWQYIHCTPLTGAVSEMDRGVLESLERDVEKGWRSWVEGNGMTYGQAMIHAFARK